MVPYFPFCQKSLTGTIYARRDRIGIGRYGYRRIFKQAGKCIQFNNRERPIFAKPGTKKNVRYIIGDNFLNFWFKYIERNRSYIELQNFDDLRAISKADYPTYSGRVLEKYFKQKLSRDRRFQGNRLLVGNKSSIGKTTNKFL